MTCSHRVITLIGYRACGKSSVAPLIAASLGWAFQDSDLLIERKAGCSIRQIFETQGEAEFRRQESEVLKELLKEGRMVVSAGGGAILSEANRELMRAAGPVVWIKVSPGVLAQRIQGDSQTADRRPSLTGKSVTDEVAEVLAAREPLYRSASTLIVDAETLTVQEVAQKILAHLSRTPAGEHRA